MKSALQLGSDEPTSACSDIPARPAQFGFDNTTVNFCPGFDFASSCLQVLDSGLEIRCVGR